MMDIFAYEFMQNALAAGILVSIISGIIGSLILVNRMVFLAGGIAHTSYGGIGLAIYLGLPVFFGASLFAVGAALLITLITIRSKHRIDTVIGVIWAVGMAAGVILVDLTPGYNVDLMGYLFGSILAVSTMDLFAMALLLIIVLSVVHFKYREILAVSYDSEYARLRGIAADRIYTVILVLSAMTIVTAIKVVGLILVIALMTIPTFIAEKATNTLYGMMMLSALLSMLFTVIGLFLSYSYDLTSGASIILTAATGMAVFFIFSAIKKYFSA